jgi:hypothetical protein
VRALMAAIARHPVFRIVSIPDDPPDAEVTP